MRSRLRNRLDLICGYCAGIIGLRQTDIMLSAYPRSGSTWLRFMLCNLLSLVEWNGKTVDFPLLNRTMVELGVNNLVKPWNHKTVPRVVKTHKPYWSVFGRAGGAIGIIRDPRDVMVSYYHYKRDRQGIYERTFSEFIRDRRFGLEAWFRHFMSWEGHWALVVRYEDMKQNTYLEFSRILNTLGVSCPDEIVHEAIRRSSGQYVRSLEACPTSPEAHEARFVRDGSIRQWPAYFDDADLAYWNRLVHEYGVDVYGKRA